MKTQTKSAEKKVVKKKKPGGRRPAVERLPTADQIAVQDYVRSRDLQWFLENTDWIAARQECQRELQARVYLSAFRLAQTEVCQWWKVKTLLPESTRYELSEAEWDALRLQVLSVHEWIRGLPLRMALRVVRTKISTNESQLRGLPHRFQVWQP